MNIYAYSVPGATIFVSTLQKARLRAEEVATRGATAVVLKFDFPSLSKDLVVKLCNSGVDAVPFVKLEEWKPLYYKSNDKMVFDSVVRRDLGIHKAKEESEEEEEEEV